MATNERDGVAYVDVSCRRHEGTRGAKETSEAVDGRVRNRILKPAAIGKQLLKREAVSLAFPKLAVRWNSLGHPRPRSLRFVDERRTNHPRVRKLDRSSRTLAKTRNRRHLGGDERAERVDQDVLVVNVTSIQVVL